MSSDPKNQLNQFFNNPNLTQNLIQSLMDTLLVIDRKATICFINRRGLELLGYTAEELLGQPLGVIVNDENLRFFKAIRELITTGESRYFDLSLVTRTGELIPSRFNGSVLRSPDGEIQYVVGVMRDMRQIWKRVGDLKEAKIELEEMVQGRARELIEAKVLIEKSNEDLRFARDQLRNVIASLPIGLIILSGEMQVRSSNQIFRQMIGNPQAELRGRWLWDILPQTNVQELGARIMSGEGIFHELQLDINGGKRCLRIKSTPIPHSKTHQPDFLLMIEDVTERKRSEEWAQKILSSAQDGVVVADKEGKIVWVNPAAKKMFRVPEKRMIGQTFASLISSDYRILYQEGFESHFQSKSSRGLLNIAYCLKGVRGNGDNFPMEIVLSDFKEDEHWGYTIFLRDKAESKIAEEAVERAYRELEQAQGHLLQSEKMASIGLLAAGIAHEINNPVGFVKSNLRTLEEYLENLIQLVERYEPLLATIEMWDKKAVEEEARRIRNLAIETDMKSIIEDIPRLMKESMDGVERVRQIVQDLKEFSHVDQKEQKVFNLIEGIETTLKIVWNEIKYKAEVIKEYSDIPDVLGYPQQLNQVFMNLLINASQSISERGTICIRTYSKDGNVVVEVEDTGCGISSENLKKIMDPFFTTKPVGKGTGLGLSVSYGIVKRHGGKIEVESTYGKGTKFRVLLPVVDQRAEGDLSGVPSE